MTKLVSVTRGLTSIVLALAVVSFVGCGGGDDKSPSKGGKTAGKKIADGKTGDGPSTSGSPKESGVGTLTGVVKFSGDAPPMKNKYEKGADIKDAAVCAANAIPDETLLVDPDSKGVANVFIYLSRAPKGAESAEATETVVLDQQGCKFVPHALTVRTGQTVKAISSDNVTHNLHTHPVKNTEINSAIKPNDKEGLAIVYDESEITPIQIVCDIHPWMKGYHLPLDHSFMAVTDKDGKFEIPNLPAGTHNFKIWHETRGYLNRSYEVTVAKDETKNVTLEYGADDFKQAE